MDGTGGRSSYVPCTVHTSKQTRDNALHLLRDRDGVGLRKLAALQATVVHLVERSERRKLKTLRDKSARPEVRQGKKGRQE